MKIDGGATIWARQIIESEIFFNKPDKWFKIWFYLVNRANHKDCKQFKRGACFMKYEWIAEATKATRNEVDHCIRWLKSAKQIATQKATRGFIVNVLNYDKFQTLEHYKSDSKSDAIGEVKAIQKRHYKQECKNDKNVKNKICSVFTYWQTTLNHPKAKLTKDRQAKIGSRLSEGYSIDDLKRTIDGCKASTYHMGDNEQGKIFDSIELLFRNGDKVESFWTYLDKQGSMITVDTKVQFSKACAELGKLAGKKRILDWLLILPESYHPKLSQFLDRAYRQGHSYSEAKDEWQKQKE